MVLGVMFFPQLVQLFDPSFRRTGDLAVQPELVQVWFGHPVEWLKGQKNNYTDSLAFTALKQMHVCLALDRQTSKTPNITLGNVTLRVARGPIENNIK